MSDTIIKFIPKDPYYKPPRAVMQDLAAVSAGGTPCEVQVQETVEFTDAGENFESVRCPFCQSDLMDAWGDAMDTAYLAGEGFANLAYMTPCCRKPTTLNDLEYEWPQGFYKTMVSFPTQLEEDIIAGILQGLQAKTGADWRIVKAYI